MTSRDWLAAREPVPGVVPPELAAAVESRLGTALDEPIDSFPDRAVMAAAFGLETLLAEGREGRDIALDLLALDAIVTYAMEAAATIGDVASVAEEAMTSLSRVVSVISSR